MIEMAGPEDENDREDLPQNWTWWNRAPRGQERQAQVFFL